MDEQMNLGDHKERRVYFGKFLKELSEVADKFLNVGPKKEAADGVKVTRFAYLFGEPPQMRHEAHWQFQSFVQVEILRELKRLNYVIDKFGLLLRGEQDALRNEEGNAETSQTKEAEEVEEKRPQLRRRSL